LAQLQTSNFKLQTLKMQSIYFFLSAVLLLFSQKEEFSRLLRDPSVKTPKMAFLINKNNYSNELILNKTGINCAINLPINSLINTPINAIENEQPIVLKSLDEIPVDAPLDAKTYESDVVETKKNVAKWSETTRQNAQHWQRHALLRWNEFARQLIAAHNVPPRVLPDSSGYPTPNRAHAADEPRYPFATPPYASRVLAYMSVAQYDAFLAAQYYQMKFQKMSVKEGGQTSTASMPRQYPSTEAAVAAASAEVLKYMFPASIAEIEEKAELAHQSAFLTEKYAETDIKAGEKLGKAIAEKVIKRAESDGMDAAQGSEAQWQKVFSRHTEGGQIAWVSKLKPVRPTIEPFFGNVRAWWVRDVAQFRPAAPPATNSEALQKEIEIVKNSGRSQDKKRMDIIVRWTDAEFTPTPIGHWNLIACDLFIKNKSSDLDIVRSLALLNRSLMDAAIVCWEAKTYYCYPRPSQVDPSVNPRLPLPNFPSYPSGHSVFSSTAATVLGNIFPSEAVNLNKMAEEASISRLYAGVHFQMDCEAGVTLGKKIGQLAIEKAK
jgi:PAP2 superfamily